MKCEGFLGALAGFSGLVVVGIQLRYPPSKISNMGKGIDCQTMSKHGSFMDLDSLLRLALYKKQLLEVQ